MGNWLGRRKIQSRVCSVSSTQGVRNLPPNQNSYFRLRIRNPQNHNSYHQEEMTNLLEIILSVIWEIVLITLRNIFPLTENNRQIGRIQVLPPDNFKLLNIYPVTSELIQNVQPFLRKNIIQGAYENVEHYLDVQFRLLREDFVGPLRTDILSYINKYDKRLENIEVYKQVKFIQKELMNEMNSYRLKYNLKPKTENPKLKYDNSKQFMFGSLLCFTNDNFQTILFGKVARADENDLKNYEIIVSFKENVTILCNKNYLMIECKIYFEPYFHVLSVLQNMDINNFPMEKYIIYAQTDPNPPKYLECRERIGVLNRLGAAVHSMFQLPITKYNLNPAQLEAFKAAISQEFAVIQGPPGTGKTFLGLKVAENLLENRAYWYNQSPILVICYTNHALDQFLEGILKFTQNLLRIGGQSKSEMLKEFNINKLRTRQGREKSRRKYFELQSLKREIAIINGNLNIIANNLGVIDFRLLSTLFPEMKFWFRGKSNEDVLEWLTEEFVKPNYQNIRIQNYYVPEYRIAEAVVKLFNTTVQDVKCLTTLKELQEEINCITQSLNELNNIPKVELTSEQLLIYNETNLNLFKKTNFLSYVKNKLSISPRKKLSNLNYFKSAQGIPPSDRWLFYFSLIDIYETELKNKLLKLEAKFQENYPAYLDQVKFEDLQIMKRSFVIGMTTTKAASLSTSLRALKCPIVIVEEAAEVLESHIISSLTKDCQHLILIGDHQQLKPSSSNYKIEKDYYLGISLFERMVRNNVQCHTLKIQHRMRPEISCLITPTIYPYLEDHESVLNRPNIMGINHCVYFIHHNHEEVMYNGTTSKSNPHEAQFFIKLALHLILNGYKAEQITILAAYLGQTFELMQEMRIHSLLKDVHICSVDNYQGEENDIILLSLVRNNKERKIGFLNIENRICVALSRAKNGLYIMGNMDLLCKNSKIWQKIRDTLNQQHAIGSSLQLRCKIHPNEITKVNCKQDFLAIPQGGCKLLCGAILNCGHSCKDVCHLRDRNHEYYVCQETCTKLLCGNDTHVCKKRCFAKCGPCNYPKLCKLQCGHTATMQCYEDPKQYKCQTIVEVTLPCGHSCTKYCYQFDDPDHTTYKCLKNCSKMRTGCTSKTEKHKCRKLCYEDCESCLAEVDKTIDDCGHSIKVECRFEPTRKDCKSKHCPRLLLCGHKCKNKCASECSTNCSELVDCHIENDCGHVITKIECRLKAQGILSNDPLLYQFCTARCEQILKCGHKCSGSCGKCLQNRIHQRCTKKCNATLICNHSCDMPCRDVCQPCQKRCLSACIHAKCGRKCCEKCRPCKESCPRRCKHQRCTNNCGELCNIQPCQEECDKKLKCGHPCVGFCGDPCPPLCRICDNEKLTEIKDDNNARFIYLENCKHVIESTALDKYFSRTENFENNIKRIQMKRCPKCNKTIGINTSRYSDFIKQTMLEIAQIKIQITGSVHENEKRRGDLETNVSHILLRTKNLGVMNLINAATFFQQELKVKNKRKFFSKILLSQLKGHIQLLEQIVNICLKLQFDWKQHSQSYKQLNLIMYSVNPINHIGVTDQQIDDIQLEILRFERILQFEKILLSANYLVNTARPEIAETFTILNEKIMKNAYKRYNIQLDEVIQSNLQDLNAKIKTNLAIKEVERTEVVRALNMKGHWFKCPNGHLFIETKCSSAIETSKCNECGA